MHRRTFLQGAAALAGASTGHAPTPAAPAAPQQPALTPKEFTAFQERRRKELWGLLGDLPERRKPTARLVRTEKHANFNLEVLELDLNGIEAAPAYLLLPAKRPKAAPAVLHIHAHFGDHTIGKEELLQGRKVMPAYTPVYAEKGIVALSFDSWCFSSRKHHLNGHTGELNTFKRMLWHGQVLFGMMMFDEVQALTYLLSRPEVDPRRVGTLGLSMGSTKAQWLAALDPRVKLCIDLCCLTEWAAYERTGRLEIHGPYYYVPRLLKHFQTQQMNELIVPRPRLSLNGRKDALTPPAGVEQVRDHLLPLYGRYGRKGDCRVELYDCAHEETPAMRKLVLEWLDRHLVKA